MRSHRRSAREQQAPKAEDMTSLAEPAPPFTRLLAEFVAAFDLAWIPAATRREAARSLVNRLGCAVGGSTRPAVGIVRSAFAPHGGKGRCKVPGLHQRTGLFTAALLQGIASRVLDFDDTHRRTIVHPAGAVPTVPSTHSGSQPRRPRRSARCSARCMGGGLPAAPLGGGFGFSPYQATKARVSRRPGRSSARTFGGVRQLPWRNAATVRHLPHGS